MEYPSKAALPAIDTVLKFRKVSGTNRSGQPSRLSTLERNNQRWDGHKDEIRRIYVDQNRTLQQTMRWIESTRGFKASVRKWKMKLKEWNFEKNIPTKEMGFIVSKAEKRKREEGKATEFMRNGFPLPMERLENFKKRKTNDLIDIGVHDAETPRKLSYNTPSATESGLDSLEMTNDDISRMRTADAILVDDTISDGEPGTFTTYVEPSKPQREHPDNLLVRVYETSQNETESYPFNVLSRNSYFTQPSEHPAPQYLPSRYSLLLSEISSKNQQRQPRDANEPARRLLRNLFRSFYLSSPYPYLSYPRRRPPHFLLFSSLLEPQELEEQEVDNILQEEFAVTAMYLRRSENQSISLNDKPEVSNENDSSGNSIKSDFLSDSALHHRLKPFWDGFLSSPSDQWSQDEQPLFHRFVRSFPLSGSKFVRWRCRLDLAIELSSRNWDEDACRQVVLSLFDAFSQWRKFHGSIQSCYLAVTKVFQEQYLRKYLQDIFPDLQIDMYFPIPGKHQAPQTIDCEDHEDLFNNIVFLIAKLALHCFSEAWWAYGHELMKIIEPDLDNTDDHYGKDYDRWITLYLQLFQACYNIKYLPEAAASLSRAFQKTIRHALKLVNNTCAVPTIQKRWQIHWIELSNPSYHDGLATLSRFQITTINELLGNRDGDLWRSLDSDFYRSPLWAETSRNTGDDGDDGDEEDGADEEDEEESDIGSCGSAACSVMYT